MTGNDALLRTALEALLEHARPANLDELAAEDPEQFAAWHLAGLAIAQADASARGPDDAPIVVAVSFELMRDLLGTLRASCA